MGQMKTKKKRNIRGTDPRSDEKSLAIANFDMDI